MTIRSQGTENAEYFQLQGKSVKEGTYTFQKRMWPLQSLFPSGKMKIHTFFSYSTSKIKKEQENLKAFLDVMGKLLRP